MDPKKTKKPGNKAKAYFSKTGDGNPKDGSLQPRILLKAKDKDNVPQKTDPVITIASKNPPNKSADQPLPGIKELENPKAIHSQEIPKNAAVVCSMTKPVNLVSGNNTLNVHAFDYLIEGNNDFAVFGAIGMRGAGKSTILNLLACSPQKKDIEQTLFYLGNNVFPINSSFDEYDSSIVDDEIHMHITKDRIILLDSAPVLANSNKKDFVTSELDDIRKIMLLLSVCHVLIVLQEDYFNINFIRLLICAEMMLQKEQKDMQTLNPKIVFVKNKCNRRELSTHENKPDEKLYKYLFKGSKLRIFSPGDDGQIDLLFVPKFLQENDFYANQEDPITDAQILRQRLLMTSRRDAIDGQESITEKVWLQIVSQVLESHHNNYFLRKYENLKEKYNLHNHVNVVENASKDKNYLTFVDT
ncbi:protein SMG9 [Uranotaenia lowii]|uniref:protein SMG9 n=1 Tax=Uranotaenia lowii TaxID=190385 RepID=UPI002478E417|nr:protein SMG9 [Uranotaenia lowii]